MLRRLRSAAGRVIWPRLDTTSVSLICFTVQFDFATNVYVSQLYEKGEEEMSNIDVKSLATKVIQYSFCQPVFDTQARHTRELPDIGGHHG